MVTDAGTRETRTQVLAAAGIGAILALVGIPGFRLGPAGGKRRGLFGEYNELGEVPSLLLFTRCFVAPRLSGSPPAVGLPDTLLHL